MHLRKNRSSVEKVGACQDVRQVYADFRTEMMSKCNQFVYDFTNFDNECNLGFILRNESSVSDSLSDYQCIWEKEPFYLIHSKLCDN